MPFLAVAALAAFTYAFRIAGPLLTGRVTIPDAAPPSRSWCWSPRR
jgi:hypothetical protein